MTWGQDGASYRDILLRTVLCRGLPLALQRRRMLHICGSLRLGDPRRARRGQAFTGTAAPRLYDHTTCLFIWTAPEPYSAGRSQRHHAHCRSSRFIPAVLSRQLSASADGSPLARLCGGCTSMHAAILPSVRGLNVAHCDQGRCNICSCGIHGNAIQNTSKGLRTHHTQRPTVHSRHASSS